MDKGLWREPLILTAALGLSGWAGWLDWRLRRIPNWLTLPALLLGLVLNTLLWRWLGLKLSLEGAGLSLGVLLPFVLARGLGAGDWKLSGAVGAFLGPSRTFLVLLGTVFIAGAMSIVEIIRQGKVRETLHNLWVIFVAYSTFHVSEARTFSLDNPGLLKIPFGVALALSMALFYVIMTSLYFLQK